MNFRALRLSTRITLVVLLLVMAGAGLWNHYENERLHEAYLNERAADFEVALHVEKARLEQSVEALRQDVVFLANIPGIAGVVRAVANHGIDPRESTPYAVWTARMQSNYSAFLRTHPDYFQIRYIGVAANGRELVRVASRDGRIEVTPPQALQAKADSDYFKAGLGLQPGRVYLSEIRLNQERGRIEEPQRPTMHAVTPVFDAGGHVFGMVVLDKEVRPLFKSSMDGLRAGVGGYVTDQQGRYLSHPDAKRAFAFEFGSQENISADFPTLKPMLELQSTRNYLPLHAVSAAEDADQLAAERVFFDAGDPQRFLLLAYHLPAAVVSGQSGIPMSKIVDMMLVMLAVAGVFLILLRHTFAPLERIALAARDIAAGNRMPRLAEKVGGEIGELVDALNIMMEKLTDSELVEREGRFRKELIEALPGIFYMIDARGRFLMWNRNMEQVTHCGAQELASSHPLDFFEGEDKASIGTAIHRVFETGEASIEAMFVGRDGTQTPYHFTGRRVERDGEPVLIGMGLDISEQRASLRVREALLRRNRALMDNSMEGIHVLGLEGNVLEVNDAFCRMLGYSRAEVMHLNVADWDVQFSADELRARIKAFIGKSDMFETLHRRKDGSLLDVEICATGVEIDGQGYLFASSRDITARKKMQSVLQRYHQVIETAMDGFWMTDAHGYLEEVNEAYAKMSGYTMQELVGMHISQLEANELTEDVKARIEKIMVRGYDRFETRHRRKDGRVVDIEVATTYKPEIEKFFVFSHNITQRKQAEQALRVAAATFETHEAILITDADSNIIRVNRAFSEITGFGAEDVLGKNPRIMSSGRHDRQFYIRMWQQLLSTGSWAGEIWDKRKNGEVYPKWMSITAVKNERQELSQYVAIFSDMTERKHIEEEMRNLAFYDTLTQLPNRRLFIERLRAALPASARRRDYGALLFLDMDRFKILNDTLGHDYGDLMLVEVANRIKSCVRETDTVARLGGDEFVVLIESVSHSEQEASRKVATVAEKIREVLALPYMIKEHEHHSSPSIGITLYRDNEQSVDTLLRHADLAMYQAKNSGRNAVRFFDPVMQDNAARHDALEEDLRHAIERGELHLFYQVQVDGAQRPIGAEALLRWQHPQRGTVMPDHFLPVAGESALIIEIGRWVLNEACAQLARWRGKVRMQRLTLTVNVSARQFAQPDFVAQVTDVIERHRIDPGYLKLELTESVASGDLNDTVEKIRALRSLGVSLAMDDFGNVYSSLYYLKQMSSERMKINRNVVQGVLEEGGDAQLVRAMVDLAKNMDLDLFAEGVETEAQFDFLKHHACKTYQGYLFSKPVPLEELEALMNSPKMRDA